MPVARVLTRIKVISAGQLSTLHLVYTTSGVWIHQFRCNEEKRRPTRKHSQCILLSMSQDWSLTSFLLKKSLIRATDRSPKAPSHTIDFWIKRRSKVPILKAVLQTVIA